MAAHEDAPPGTGGLARLFADLQADAVEGHGVVGRDRTLFFFAEDLLESDGAEGHECRGGIGRRPGEGGVVVGDETVAQIGVGGVDRGDAREAQFVDEAILQGAVEAPPAAAGLGGVGADVLDAQTGERPADMGEVLAIHGAAGLGGVEGPAGTVGVQSAGQADRGEDVGQGGHDGREGFAGQSWA